MPKVRFYVLPSASQEARLLFTCKVLEKVFRQQKTCYVLSDDENQGKALDERLWTFRAGSFVPHEIYQGIRPRSANAVLIGVGQPPEAWMQVLVNLSERLPENLERYEKIFEILSNDETSKRLGRQRYRLYQQLGLDLATHTL